MTSSSTTSGITATSDVTVITTPGASVTTSVTGMNYVAYVRTCI